MDLFSFRVKRSVGVLRPFVMFSQNVLAKVIFKIAPDGVDVVGVVLSVVVFQ